MIEWIRRYWFTLLMMGLALLVLVRLNFIYQNNPQQFWQEVGLMVGSVAVIFAGISALIASRSLELTRASQRPFLTTVEEPTYPSIVHSQGKTYCILHIRNTGNLPADRISVLCAIYTASKKDIGVLLGHAKTALAPPIYFPGVEVEHTFYMNQEQFNECKEGQCTIRVHIKYGNRIAKKNHNTQRSFIYEPLITSPLSPIDSTHRDDWWD